MESVPRHLFVPPASRAEAYEDRPLEIGGGQTISQPTIVAIMTVALKLEPNDRVLEIGTGSGYQAAVLSRLCRSVYTIEIDPELAASATRRLHDLGITNVIVRFGDGFYGWPEAAPFDAIMVTASTPRVPQALLEQLADGGRLIAPVERRDHDQQLERIIRHGPHFTREPLDPVTFVPMTGAIRTAPK